MESPIIDVFKAGSWLSETAIASKSTLRLSGVRPGNDTFRNKDFAIQLPNSSLTSRKRAATLFVPKPRTILGLLLAVDPNLVINAATGAVVATKVSTVQVLIYDFDDENQVFLDGHYWEPCSIGGAISVHFISTSEGAVGDHHMRETEDVMAHVITGYPGLALGNPVPVPAWCDIDNPNYGSLPGFRLSANLEAITTNQGTFACSMAELEDIGSRATRLNRLGRIKQEARPVQSLWHEADPLGEEVSNCWPLSVG